MFTNISLLDVIIRLNVVLVITLAALFLNFFPVYILGMLLLVSALSGYCPVYHILGISTCDPDPKH